MARHITCTPKGLPKRQLVAAAATAASINPVNHPPLDRLRSFAPGFALTKQRIAVVTTKYWGGNGVKLTVGFLDSPPRALRARILEHMNAWSRCANVVFTESRSEPRVRIARIPGDGYWSYVGTDILHIDEDEPTMNLEGFTMETPETEFRRVVRHETGHTLGCPHEHMRRELVKKIDVQKAIAFYRDDQGWSAAETRQQVLTPIEEGSLLGTDHVDPRSIMCYQISGAITKSGEPILGGRDISRIDCAFLARVYPKRTGPTPPEAAAKRKRRRRVRKEGSRRRS